MTRRNTREKVPEDLPEFLSATLKARRKRYNQALELCQRACSDRAVHFLRTAARRLLASLDLHAAVAPGRRVKSARRILKDQLRRFSNLRDTHVQLVLASRLSSEFPGRDAFVDALHGQERRQVEKVYQFIDRLTGKKLRKLVTALRKDLPLLSAARARAATRAKLTPPPSTAPGWPSKTSATCSRDWTALCRRSSRPAAGTCGPTKG